MKSASVGQSLSTKGLVLILLFSFGLAHLVAAQDPPQKASDHININQILDEAGFSSRSAF